MIVTIEGNIGSGKTTLLSMIKDRLDGYLGGGKRIVYVPEPVEEWQSITDDAGKSMLDLLYSDPKTHSFAFQMMAFITRYNAIKQTQMANPGAILVMERCLQTDAEVFAKMLRDSGDILPVHYKIYEKWANALSAEFVPDMIVYARADPSKSMERVKIRARTSEAGITLDYLTACHQKHEDWIIPIISATSTDKHIVFDANEEFIGDKASRVDDLVKEMMAFIL